MYIINYGKNYYEYRNILMTNSINSDNDEDYKKLKKYIGIDSEELTESTTKKRQHSSTNNYDKLLNLCSKANINIYISTTCKKTKSYDQLLLSCNKKKRDIIKKYVMEVAQYSTRKGFEKLSGTYVIDSLSDNMISKLRAIDTVIEMINKELHPKNKNILSLLNIKGRKVSREIDNGIILEEYVTS
jgi:hypothetical protein